MISEQQFPEYIKDVRKGNCRGYQVLCKVILYSLKVLYFYSAVHIVFKVVSDRMQ